MAVPDPMATRPVESGRRSALGAALLSLLLPGLGQLYLGQTRRAVGLFGALLALYAAAMLCRYGWLPRFWMFAVILVTAICLCAFAIAAAAVGARRSRVFPRPRYDRWYVYLGLLVAVPIVMAAMDAAVAAVSTGPGLYHAPSASMNPTIRPGETFLADTRYFLSRPPARGEVVAYTLPGRPDVHFVKRIVALAGDRVEIRGGHAIVNGKAADEPYVEVGDAAFSLNNMPAATVPPGTVFVLGDNRANSADSRLAWHGPVPVGNLGGRVTDIVLSADIGRVGKWIGSPR